MKLLNEHHSFTGMQRDISISKHPASFLYDAKNIRLTQRGDDTLYAITNEKGTERTGITINGTYLGHCLLNNYLVIFSTTTQEVNPDYITRIDLGKGYTAENPSSTPPIEANPKILYHGNLEFSLEHPIEAIPSYENEDIQKVYWTDGNKPPRMINIVQEEYIENDDNQFDFIRNLTLNETVTVQKIIGGNGMFPSGVIQYAFTYYNKYGQESNIFYTTPLLYVSPSGRGGKPDEVVDNSFKITINNVENTRFDYLRIYSIQRTSINGTPICRRVQDIELKDGTTTVSYTDTGTNGDSIDPTELLYKGGEVIIAQTIEQKDGTLFLGNLELDRNNINTTFNSSDVSINQDTSYRTIYPEEVTIGNYAYANQLTSTDESGDSVPCAGFKRGNYYRLGVQFQHKTGKWSDPIYINDYAENRSPSISKDSNDKVVVNLPTFTGTILADKLPDLNKYKKVRAVVVYPNYFDRVVLCQGVSTTAITDFNEENYQSSWFFRPFIENRVYIQDNGTVTPVCGGSANDTQDFLNYEDKNITIPSELRTVEIPGTYQTSSNVTELTISNNFATLNSPDIEFDDVWTQLSLLGVKYRDVGKVSFKHTLSQIDIQTETPAIDSGSNGFTEVKFDEAYSYGIVSGPLYEDYLVDDRSNGSLEKFSVEHNPVRWMVYPWQRTGSLNNDIERPTGKGVRTAVLKKKVLSHLRYADTIYSVQLTPRDFEETPQIFIGDQVDILKFGDKLYRGNVDTMLNPSSADGLYFMFNDDDIETTDGVDTPFDYKENGDIIYDYWKTYSWSEQDAIKAGLYRYNSTISDWKESNNRIGTDYLSLVIGRYPIRMKYKSTPHLIMTSNLKDGSHYKLTYKSPDSTDKSVLPLIEIVRPSDSAQTHAIKPFYREEMFGGDSLDAQKANLWIPCGEPVKLQNTDGPNNTQGPVTFEYSWGDTYFQRWECMKTYPFTNEDLNQIIEIGSFMLETYVNIDGRCDRNRGQITNVSPLNFNLMNPVYSQLNNFFSYRILDESYYELNSFPNQITWTKEKISGAEIDPWTNITLANTYDLDGSKGGVVSLNNWRDQLYCFQRKGVSNILFNSRVQIPTSDGVPVEISNNYKVDGYRYLSDGIGCDNKLLIKETPAGIYFIDQVSNNLYYIGEGIQDVSTTHCMTSWFKSKAGSLKKLLYDDVHRDLYVTLANDSLCFSEILGQFTSFMDYANIPLIESYNNKVFTLHSSTLYKMFEGEYNDFFPTLENNEEVHHYQPWYFTFISNGSDRSTQDFDKIFSNIDYRMDMFGKLNIREEENTYQYGNSLNYIQVTNEYQNTGVVDLSHTRRSVIVNGSYNPKDANLRKKFRIWRIQIPRNSNSIDRIRNPWCKITLGNNENNNLRAVLQDLNVQYYL